jgi:hypothetical protein
VNSFATNEFSSQNTLCSREEMKKAVKVMHQAVRGSSSTTDKRRGITLGEWISRDKTLRFHVISEGTLPTRRTKAADA